MEWSLFEILMFVAGVTALIRGRTLLTSHRVLKGSAARAFGRVFMLPLFLGKGGAWVFGLVLSSRMEAQPIGEQIPRPVPSLTGDDFMTLLMFPTLIIGVTLLLGAILGYLGAVSIPRVESNF